MGRGVKGQVASMIEQGGADRWWHPSDFAGIAADPRTVDRALARMVCAGELHRVRRGLYWRGRVTRFGMTPPDEISAINRIAGSSGIGPSGISAANDLGLTTQVPGRITVAIPRRAPRPLAGMRFVDRSGRVGRVVHDLNWMEVAFLEVLGDWDRVVDVDEEIARQKLASLVRSGDVRVDRLRAAARSEPASLVRRLFEFLSIDSGEIDPVEEVERSSGESAVKA
jgi:hypothetical protein